MFMLTVVAIVTSLQNPTEHPGLTVHLPYETQYTCEHGIAALDIEAIAAAAGVIIKTKHTTIRRVTAECHRTLPRV